MNQSKEIVYIRIDEIIPNRFQPRLTFDEQELKELSESIKMHGIIQPLVLRKVGDKYEIIAGERRYKAATIAGLQVVPAIITEMDDKESAEVALVENLQRKDLTAIEEAQSYKKILDMGYLTQEELASRMGVSQSTIANKLRLLNLAIPVKDALLNNRISERHARSLLAINDINLQVSMLNRIISERLTVRQTDEEISKLIGKNTLFESQTPTGVDTNNILKNSQNVYKENKPKDIDMLLRPQSANNIYNTETTTKEQTINPFQEVEPEIMSFEFEKPNSNYNSQTSTNSLIEEFRRQQDSTPLEEVRISEPNSIYEDTTSDATSGPRSLSRAISNARTQIRNIEQMGFNVETEEFDFDDMYQIIIKIKKD